MRERAVVLLVEDDEVDAMTVIRAFQKNKVTNTVHRVSDGEEALRFLRRQDPFADQKSSPRPSLILLDLNLPRMNGHEFLRVVKHAPELCGIPVVVLTTSAELEDVRASFRGGVAGYIVKPVTFHGFVESIGTLDLYWTLSETP